MVILIIIVVAFTMMYWAVNSERKEVNIETFELHYRQSAFSDFAERAVQAFPGALRFEELIQLEKEADKNSPLCVYTSKAYARLSTKYYVAYNRSEFYNCADKRYKIVFTKSKRKLEEHVKNLNEYNNKNGIRRTIKGHQW